MKALTKGHKLRPGKRTKIVRSASISDGSITKVRTVCLLNGKKLKGKNKKTVCKTKTRKTRAAYSNVKVWATPSCSVGVKIRTKITATSSTGQKTTWQRTWKVKNKPKTYCALNGNG